MVPQPPLMSRPEETPETPKRRRPRGRKRLGLLLLLLVGLFWLNGPGWRWIGGIGLRHALDKAGLAADFELHGTLVGGIRVERLALSGGPLRRLEIGSAGPLYDFKRALRGELDGVSVSRIDAVVDLAAPPLPGSPDAEPESPPEPLPATLRKIRTLLRPLDLRAADFRFELVRGAERLLILDTSDFSHAPGSDEFVLDLGTLAVGPGYEFAAQKATLRWTDDGLALDRFDLTPRLGIRDLVVKVTPQDDLTASVVARIEDSQLRIDATPSSALVRLEGPPLKLHEAARNFLLDLPAEASLRTLEARVEGIDQTPDRWTASARAELTELRYQEWQAGEVLLDASKEGEKGALAWSVAALDGEVKGSADLVWRDLAAGRWSDFEATAKAAVPQLSPIFAALKKQLVFAPADAPPLPASSLTLDARVDSSATGLRSADARWLLSAESDAPSIAGEARWVPEGKLTGNLGSEGLRATWSLDPSARTYEATATLDAFKPERLAPWAAAAGVTLPTGMTASLTWRGDGAFAASPHRGSFELPSFEWLRKDQAPLQVRTNGSYAWPESVILTELVATTAGQTIRAEATLADRLLKIPRLEWLDGETRLVGGRAEVPVPENPADLKEFLRQELPLNLFLESEWIDAARLAAWLPDGKSPLAGGSGRVNLVVTGTPAAPKLSLDAALKGLRLPDRPDLPLTDATFALKGADGDLALSGEVRPASYSPLTLNARMPFKPGEWADNPGRVLEEKLEARANIPRLDLATFRSLVPDADQLGGSVEGFATVSGTIGKPELGGELRLSGGSFSRKNSPAPPITNASLLLRLAGQQVLLESLAFESSGGRLDARGSANIADPAKPTFDLTARATALPLKRDESMIVRADADLALRGDLQQATISGSVDLVDSLFYRDFEILPVRVPFTAPARPRLPAIDPEEKAADLPAPFADWALDVRLRTRDPLLIRGNLAKGSAIADIRFGGTLGKIAPEGGAVLRDITARLPFSTLKVHNGKVNFTPAGGLNPELDIRGSSNIGRYDVNVFFYGPVNAPKTALTSDPPLPESEIMTLLATGTTSDGLEDGQAATMKAAQLFIEEWRRGRLPFGEQLSKALVLLNNVDVRVGEDDPLTGKRLNSATIEVTDRIFVSGSVDKESNTRVLGAFVLRFK